jgi:Smr domain
MCGNPIPLSAAKCRFCETLQTAAGAAPSAEAVRTIDLEAGMPTVEEALRRLDAKLSLAIAQNVRVVRVIHGYGSSGRGGKIRDACRRVLASMVSKNQVTGMIRGEDHSAARVPSQELIRRVPGLKSSTRSDADNAGITLVEV